MSESTKMLDPELRIALCDDEASSLVVMEMLVASSLRLMGLSESRVSIRSASDYQSAEELVAEPGLDLLLVDLMWPGQGNTEWKRGLALVELAKRMNRELLVVLVTSKVEQEKDFRNEARRAGADLALTWDEAFGAGRMSTVSEFAERLRSRIMSVVPTVSSVRDAVVGLVGIDTVSYSEKGDSLQVDIVRSFLAYVSESWHSYARQDVRPFFVFTGDGLFLGLSGEAGPRLALSVALDVWGKLTALVRYETRIAVHFGPVKLVGLSSGVDQMVGNSVNWLFRAVNAAAANDLVITEEYYKSILNYGREGVGGYKFSRRESQAKHGRALVVYDVRRVE